MRIIRRLEIRVKELRTEAEYLQSKELEAKADYLDNELEKYKSNRNKRTK